MLSRWSACTSRILYSLQTEMIFATIWSPLTCCQKLPPNPSIESRQTYEPAGSLFHPTIPHENASFFPELGSSTITRRCLAVVVGRGLNARKTASVSNVADVPADGIAPYSRARIRWFGSAFRVSSSETPSGFAIQLGALATI